MAQGVKGTVTLPLMISTAQWDKLLEIACCADMEWDVTLGLMLDNAKLLRVSGQKGASLSVNMKLEGVC